MAIEIEAFRDQEHRQQVIQLWITVFGYKELRNKPEITIAKKLAAKDGLFFIASDNQRVVGTIMAGYDGHRGWIYSLAVIPDMRKKEIGTRLLKHAETRLRALGCLKINLQILSTNESVQQFYLKNGYRLEERISMGKVIEENIP